ncbi:MAG: hypothetical protein ACI85N_001056 [Gammaproteobacteria bacterium]|jgi:hypothetical protein
MMGYSKREIQDRRILNSIDDKPTIILMFYLRLLLNL